MMLIKDCCLRNYPERNKSIDVCIERLEQLVNQLPPGNFAVLDQLLHFFMLLTSHSADNKMTGMLGF